MVDACAHVDRCAHALTHRARHSACMIFAAHARARAEMGMTPSRTMLVETQSLGGPFVSVEENDVVEAMAEFLTLYLMQIPQVCSHLTFACHPARPVVGVSTRGLAAVCSPRAFRRKSWCVSCRARSASWRRRAPSAVSGTGDSSSTRHTVRASPSLGFADGKGRACAGYVTITWGVYQDPALAYAIMRGVWTCVKWFLKHVVA